MIVWIMVALIPELSKTLLPDGLVYEGLSSLFGGAPDS